MQSIQFPEANAALAKDQPEYQTLYVHVQMADVPIKQPAADVHIIGQPKTKKVPWAMTAYFELSDEEIAEVVRTKKIWHTQMVMGNLFQPIMMSTQNPFELCKSDYQTEEMPNSSQS